MGYSQLQVPPLLGRNNIASRRKSPAAAHLRCQGHRRRSGNRRGSQIGTWNGYQRALSFGKKSNRNHWRRPLPPTLYAHGGTELMPRTCAIHTTTAMNQIGAHRRSHAGNLQLVSDRVISCLVVVHKKNLQKKKKRPADQKSSNSQATLNSWLKGEIWATAGVQRRNRGEWVEGGCWDGRKLPSWERVRQLLRAYFFFGCGCGGSDGLTRQLPIRRRAALGCGLAGRRVLWCLSVTLVLCRWRE